MQTWWAKLGKKWQLGGTVDPNFYTVYKHRSILLNFIIFIGLKF